MNKRKQDWNKWAKELIEMGKKQSHEDCDHLPSALASGMEMAYSFGYKDGQEENDSKK